MTLFADVEIKFLPAPVVLVMDPDTGPVISAEKLLIINFTDSYTMDGINFTDSFTFRGEEGEGVGEDWVWEWEWECVIPGEGGAVGRRCVYEGGREMVMPGGGEYFEGEEGEELEEGVGLMFVVRVKVRDSGGEVVGEGSWERVFSPVSEEVVEAGVRVVGERWGCGGGREGYSV